MSESWTQRLFGGFRKTSERLGENLAAAVGTAKLDDATLDDIEDALILSDLGPAPPRGSAPSWPRSASSSTLTNSALKQAVAEEIAAILRPVAKPLEIDAFPRPQVILVIGVNGSGKTTTIAKLAHLFQEAGLWRDAGRGRHLPRRRDRPARGLGRAARRADRHAAPKAAIRRASCSTRSKQRPTRASTC